MKIYTAPALLVLTLLFGCSSAPDRPEYVSETRNRAADYTEFGNRYLDRAQFGQALKFYTLALESNIAIDNQEGIVLSRNAIGETFLSLGRYDEAGESFTAALEGSKRLEREDLELRSLNNLGKLALRLGKIDNAREIFDQANSIIDAGRSPSEEVSADVYHSTGALYKILADYPRAEEYLMLSLKLNRALKRQEEIASSYYVLASVYSKQDRYEEAENYLLQALELDKKIENKLGIADDYYALGLIAEGQADYEQAYRQYRTAVDKYIILNKVDGTLDTLRRLERMADLLGNEDEALSYRETIRLLEESR